MIEIIINSPHAQTMGKRLINLMLNLTGWCLWAYFLFPIAALGCSFLGFLPCGKWTQLSYEYVNVQQILLVYLKTIIAIIFIWMAWVVYDHAKLFTQPLNYLLNQVNVSDLSQTFGVAENIIDECQNSRFIVVHFDENGNIVKLDKT